MKFICLQENFAKGLGIVSKAVPTKSTFPLLSNVLISAVDGRIRLAATDYETFITTYVGGSVEAEGKAAVPAKLLREFVSTLAPAPIEAVFKDEVLHVVSQKTKVKFNSVDPADFPEVPAFDDAVSCLHIDPKTFEQAVSYVAFAAALDSTRPIFSGVLLQYADGVLTVAASDGFRLSEKVLTLEESAMPDFSIVLPSRVLMEIARIFASSGESVRFSFNEDSNRALFASEDTTISTGVLEGQFPDYKRIIPTETTLKAQVLATPLLEAVKLASIFAADQTNSVKLVFNPEGSITISSSAQETGDHQSQFEAVIEGEGLEVIFNSKYLLDFLNNVKTEQLVMETTGNNAPCLIKPRGEEGFLHLIMPIRVEG